MGGAGEFAYDGSIIIYDTNVLSIGLTLPEIGVMHVSA